MFHETKNSIKDKFHGANMIKKENFTLPIKLIIGFHVLNLVLWFFGQTWAVFDYDTAASWGLQDPRILIDPAIVEVNRGIGLTDTFILLPIFLLATIGLLKRKFWGNVFSWMAFALTFYWPVVFWCSQYFFQWDKTQPNCPFGHSFTGYVYAFFHMGKLVFV